MPYAYPNSTSMSSDMMYIFYYINQVTSGWFAALILFAIYTIIIFVYYKATDEFAAGMAISGFAVFVIALLFWLSSFLATPFFIITIALAILGVVTLLIASA